MNIFSERVLYISVTTFRILNIGLLDSFGLLVDFKTYCNLQVCTVFQRLLPVPKRGPPGKLEKDSLAEIVMAGQRLTALNLKRENSDYI